MTTPRATPTGRGRRPVTPTGRGRRPAALLGALLVGWLIAVATITFSEPVGLGSGYLRVTDSSAKTVSTGTAAHPDDDGTKLQAALPAGLADGSYLISWRVVSQDSHVVAGSARFVVGAGPLLDFATGSTGEASGAATGEISGWAS